MPPLSRRAALGGGVLAVSLLRQASAQPAPVTRVRGTIVSLAGDQLTVATREGPTQAVTLAEPLTVAALRRVALDEIAVGQSLGVVAEPGPDGELRAVAITVLPVGARITERQFAWDLAPGTSMNDGPVAAVVEGSAGRDFTLSIMGRSVLVRVGPDVPLLMPIPASRSDLVAGAAVFINATRGADGTLTAPRVVVGRDGVAPAI